MRTNTRLSDTVSEVDYDVIHNNPNSCVLPGDEEPDLFDNVVCCEKLSKRACC